MSRENVQLVAALQPGPDTDLARLFRDDATANATIDQLARFFHDDFEIDAPQLSATPYKGLRGLREGWLDWLEPWESYRVEVEDLIDAGDDVVVLVRDYGRRAEMEEEVSVFGAAVWTVRDGKVARAAFYATRDLALEAVGLSE